MALDRSGPEAVVDIGTNTAVLLVPANAQTGYPKVEVERFVRLGEELAATGRIVPAALGRLGEALNIFGALLDARGIASVRVIGTSACRDASNVADVAAVVRSALGVELEVISGEEEAALAFIAAKHALLLAHAESTSPILVVDVGGGSTEVVSGPASPVHTGPRRVASLNVGSVRCSEMFVESDVRPVADESLQRMQAFVRDALDQVEATLQQEARGARHLVFIDGIATVLNRLRATGASPAATTRMISRTELTALFKRVALLSVDELTMLAPECLRGRADVLPAAMVILLEVMDWAGFTRCTVAETSVRHGALLTD